MAKQGIGPSMTRRGALAWQELQQFVDSPQSLGAFKVDLKTMTWEGSAEFHRILGIDEQFPHTTQAWRELIHPEDRDRVHDEATKRVFTQGKPFASMYRIVRPRDQQVRWVIAMADYLLDEQGHPVQMLGTMRDHTLERLLHEGFNLLNFALDHVDEAVYLVDRFGQFLYVNDQALRMHGRSRQEMLTLWVGNVDELCRTEADWQEHWQMMVQRQSVTFESQHVLSDGQFVPVEVHSTYFEYEGEAYILGISRNVAERKALQEEVQRYRAHLEDLVAEKTRAFADINTQLQHLLRLQRVQSALSQSILATMKEESYRQDLCQLLVDHGVAVCAWLTQTHEDHQTVAALACSGQSQRQLLEGFICPMIAAEGSYSLPSLPGMPCDHIRVIPFHQEDRQLMHLYLGIGAWSHQDEETSVALEELLRDFVRGVSFLRLRQNHRRAVQELALRVRNETQARHEVQDLANKLQLILDSMGQAIIVWDREERLSVWNKGVQQIFPKTFARLYRTLERSVFLQWLREEGEGLGTLRPWQDWLKPLHERIHAADGRVIDVIRATASDGSHLALLSDMTEIFQLRESLAQSERLASLGSMVAGIAHELNTPIGVALTASSSLLVDSSSLQQMVESGSVRKSALLETLESLHMASRLVEGNLRRATDLISGFKQVAVDQTLSQRRIFSLRQMLQEVMFTLQPMLKPNGHTWSLEQEEELTMDSYPGPLGQVLTNLVSNAVQHGFSGPGGRLHLRVQKRDTMVELLFTDDGQGIQPENIKRVFDPFFTTKMGRGGTGLGLHIVHNNITRILQGQIGVRSEPGAGSQFVILIPLVVTGDVDASDVEHEQRQDVL